MVALAQQVLEIERELDERRITYPRLVRQGALAQQVADWRIAALEAALGTLKTAYSAQQLSLFGGG